MDYVALTDRDRARILQAVGIESFEDLLAGVPGGIPRADLKLPPGLPESTLLTEARALAARDASSESHVSFLGGGAYEHLIPSAVRYITSRGEFLTAYTPYQPEASQGTLQAMFEFQSLLCALTGMEVANASLYDGASALAEACLMVLRETGRGEILAAGTLHPEYRAVLGSYLKHSDVKVTEIPAAGGTIDLEALEGELGDNTAAVVVQNPNACGCLEPVESAARLAHEKGALIIAAVNPISLGILKSPGEMGADVVVGEGQPLGNELNYGGPYLGLFACRERFLRKVPGRIVGMTRDAGGKRGYVLTLQTREQHIRRERATSNICTNEAMMALAAAVYLAALGKEGFRQLAVHNAAKAHYAQERLTRIPGVRPLFERPFFNEFALQLSKDPEEVNRRLFERGFLGGLPLKRWNPEHERGWLVCVTEARSKGEIDRFARAVEEIL